ncbi:MAG: hypothetical protein N4A44_04475 [Alphaproteobacteria bacterium]|jgi:hypothetical protein|nr:hypothetical protein [Alphaproteobacteria bacterium]
MKIKRDTLKITLKALVRNFRNRDTLVAYISETGDKHKNLLNLYGNDNQEKLFFLIITKKFTTLEVLKEARKRINLVNPKNVIIVLEDRKIDKRVKLDKVTSDFLKFYDKTVNRIYKSLFSRGGSKIRVVRFKTNEGIIESSAPELMNVIEKAIVDDKKAKKLDKLYKNEDNVWNMTPDEFLKSLK